MANIVWTAQPRQEKFLMEVLDPNGADEILYGGAAGGGKTDALLITAIIWCQKYPGSWVLFLRRTFPELEQKPIPRSKELIPQSIAKYNESKHRWTFDAFGGSVLQFGSLDKAGDESKYQSAEYSLIIWDELTHFEFKQYVYMISRNRCSKTYPDFKPKVIAGTNPGGVGHCVPFGEVLTTNGWVDIKDIETGDAVYTVNERGELIIDTIEQKHVHEFSGQLWNANTRGLTIVCTPEHKIAKSNGARNNIGLFSLVEAQKLPGQTRILRTAIYEGKSIEGFTVPDVTERKRLKQPKTITGEQYVKLMGWFLAEGCTIDKHKAFVIAQIKEKGRAEIKNLLGECGFVYHETKKDFIVYSVEWWNYFKQFGKSREKFIPREIINASSQQLTAFFISAMSGDGHWNEFMKSGQYYSISKQLADDMSEIAFKLGYSVYVSSRQRKNRIGLSYCVNFNSRKHTEILTGQHCYKVETKTKKIKNVSNCPYSGLVFDIGVPKYHNFILRQNGSIWVSGNSWVKERWIDPQPPEKVWAVQQDEEDIRLGLPARKRVFIPAKVQDNQILLKANPGYISAMKELPDAERKALLDGSWDSFIGQYFKCWNRDLHVVKPFEIPRWWKHFLSLDYGLDMCACYEHVTDQSGKVYTVNEIYQPDLSIPEAAETILKRFEGGKFQYMVASPDLWNRRQETGRSGIEILMDNGLKKLKCPIIKADDRRVIGWQNMYDYLLPRKDEEGGESPYWNIFDNCVNLVRTLPNLVRDDKNPNDIAGGCDDHGAECLVGETEVFTSSGNKPIKDIQVGEMVLTRKGFKKVLASKQTGHDVPVFCLVFSNGATIKATATHPVWIVGKGFVRVSELKDGDKVEVLETWQRTLSYLMKSNFTDTQIPQILATKLIIDQPYTMSKTESDTFIKRFGSFITEQFQKNITFITKMGIRLITLSKISIVFLVLTTCRNMQKAKNLLLNTLPISSKRLLFGTEPKKREKFQGEAVTKFGTICNQNSLPVRFAERNTNQNSFNKTWKQTSVQTPVNQITAENSELTTKNGNASFVETSISSTNIVQGKPVPANVVELIGLYPVGKADVCNLEVEDEHEFFANGILVHNSVRYFLKSRPPVSKSDVKSKADNRQYRKETQPLISTKTGW